MDTHDRILEAYQGKMGDVFMRDTQRRIHWICKQVTGSDILDVGCSQGIVPVLLGREGKTVLGVDLDSVAVEQANAFLADQPDQVRDKVRFECADFMTMDLGGRGFDTIVMTEVLEHLVDPEKFVGKAHRLLRDGGCMVVTVPFGINDFIDHKSTFYLTGPYEILSKFFSLRNVEFMGKWIGFQCIKGGTDHESYVLDEAQLDTIRQLEDAFFAVERQLVDDRKSKLEALTKANTLYREASVDNGKLKVKIDEAVRKSVETQNRLGSELEAFKVQIETVRSQLKDANEKYRKSTEQVAQLKEKVGDLLASGKVAAEREKRLLYLEQELERVNGRSEVLFSDLKEANEKHRESTEQVAQLKEKIGELLAFEQVAAEREKQLVFVRSELASAVAERDAFRTQLADSEQRLRSSEATAQHGKTRLVELEQKLASVAAERDGYRRQLEDSDRRSLTLEAIAGQVKTRLEEVEQELVSATSERDVLSARMSDLEVLNARNDTLEQELASANTERDAAQKLLNEANLKYRQVTAQVSQLKDKLQEQQVALFKARTSYSDSSAQVVELKKGRDTAVAELRSLRLSISYRLGRILTSAMRSPREWPSAIGRLWMLWKDAWRVIKARSEKKTVPAEGVFPGEKAGPKEIIPLETPKPKPPTERVCLDSSRLADGLSGLRIACILDEFSFASYAPEAKFTQLTPGGWQSELEEIKPDMLFVESAWRGKEDQWGSKVGHCSAELQGIVAWCRDHSVPTAFWNKEDPVHFETFLNTAHQFDYVFTTDIDCIHRYKGALGHDRVQLLPFACQPRQHNPIETYSRKNAFCFAGAYYVRYPERTADLSRMVAELSSWRPFEIYDRNYGKTDPNYQFPPEYSPFIVGNLPFDQIDKAYKGYRYAINLNSIKQSQSMFARRVYELLASNTVTVSNYSRGVRLMFGDLVFCSDEPGEILRRLKRWEERPDGLDPLRLAALRKVMMEHTYARRLSTVVSAMIQDGPVSVGMPHVVLVGKAETEAEARALIATFDRQGYQAKTMLLAVAAGVAGRLDTKRDDIQFIEATEAGSKTLLELLPQGVRVCGVCAGDYYGAHYVEDLVIATTYSDARVIGKDRRFALKEGKELVADEGKEYQWVHRLESRCAMLRIEDCGSASAWSWLEKLAEGIVEGEGLLAVDRFSYCLNGADLSAEDASRVDGAAEEATYPGIALSDLQERATKIGAEAQQAQAIPFWAGNELAEYFRLPTNKPLLGKVSGCDWEVESALPDGNHVYVYAAKDIHLARIANAGKIDLCLDASPGLNIQLGINFLDSTGRVIGIVVKGANRNETVDSPEGAVRIRLGLRIYGSGSASIKGLYWGRVSRMAPAVVPMQRYLLVTNQYPAYDNLYRNGFVHSRVRSYRERGVGVDVFRMATDSLTEFCEFEGIDVVSGDASVLDRLLSTGVYAHVMVHFLCPVMWGVLERYVEQIPVTAWVHGFEIHAWQRRAFNLITEAERQKAIRESDARMTFWRGIFEALPSRLHFVFVSRSLANEAMEDVGIPLPESAYSIIPNPIDTGIFSYEKKDPEQRKRILSIRPFASRQYANDLSVAAIQLLAKEPFFNELEFLIIGDGVLFAETLAPIRDYPNVRIERRFLRQYEIANVHKDNGVFLCPSRWDSHGVSRDESMASGLVPITNRVAAIPEFVDETCGKLVESEDALGLANAIVQLATDPDLFGRLSFAAATRVRTHRDMCLVVAKELSLFVRMYDAATPS